MSTGTEKEEKTTAGQSITFYSNMKNWYLYKYEIFFTKYQTFTINIEKLFEKHENDQIFQIYGISLWASLCFATIHTQKYT